jgi:plastocyanin
MRRILRTAHGVCLLLLTGCGAEADLGPVANVRAVEDIRTAFLEGAESSGETAATPVGSGWATIRGQFVFDGTPPEMPPYNVNKEPNICAPNGPPLQETLVVDSGTGGIRNVAVYLRDASRVHDEAKAKSEPVEFDQKVCVFLTHVLGVTVGQTIEIKNSDPTGHNTNIMGRANKFNQTIPADGTIPYVPQKEEATPAPVTCSIHPWMSAYILPRENNYYAITAEDGTFEIANVPAGEEIEFQVWHERGGAAGGGLSGNTADTPELEWDNRGRFTVTLQPDEVKELKVVVPAAAFSG